MGELKAVGSNDPALLESERLLAEQREKKSPETVDKPVATTKKKKPTPEPVSETDATESASLLTKLLLLVLPNKKPASPEEKNLIGGGLKGIFKKYPKMFEWFPFLSFAFGLVMFVLNRLANPKTPAVTTETTTDETADQRRVI